MRTSATTVTRSAFQHISPKGAPNENAPAKAPRARSRDLQARAGGLAKGSCVGGFAGLGGFRHGVPVRARIRALGDTGRLAATIAQVIELCAADLAAAHDFHRVDH